MPLVDMTPEQLAETIFDCARMESRALTAQLKTAFAKRDQTIAELRTEVAQLRGAVRALQGERKRAAVLADDAEARARLRRTAEAAEARLSGAAR